MGGPGARVDREPGQVRKEAAISVFCPVPPVARPCTGRLGEGEGDRGEGVEEGGFHSRKIYLLSHAHEPALSEICPYPQLLRRLRLFPQLGVTDHLADVVPTAGRLLSSGRPSRLRPMKPPWQAMASQNSRALNISGWALGRGATTTIQVHGTDSRKRLRVRSSWLSASALPASAPRSPTIAARDAACLDGLHLRLLKL